MSGIFDHRGKNLFVAGGSSGINLGIAHGFAAAGANVAILGRSQPKLDAAVAELARHGGKVAGYSATCATMRRSRRRLRRRMARGANRCAGLGRGGEFSGARARHVGQRLQGGDRHRRARHLQRAARGASLPEEARRVGHQHLGAAILQPDADAGACLRRQGRRRHGDARPRARMGRGRHPRQFDRAGPDRRHRGHAPPRPQRRGARAGDLARAAGPDGHARGHRRGGAFPRLAACALDHRRGHAGRWRLVADGRRHDPAGIEAGAVPGA